MPAGPALSLRSNIPALAEFYFAQIDESSHDRAIELRDGPGHIVVGGDNYGQGSSREHGALVPAYLRLRLVIAKSFARIHGQNLVNFGIVPLLFDDAADHEVIAPGDVLHVEGIHAALREHAPIEIHDRTRDHRFAVHHDLSERQVRVLIAGGLINEYRSRNGG
jgi:aconitate hydratase